MPSTSWSCDIFNIPFHSHRLFYSPSIHLLPPLPLDFNLFDRLTEWQQILIPRHHTIIWTHLLFRLPFQFYRFLSASREKNSKRRNEREVRNGKTDITRVRILSSFLCFHLNSNVQHAIWSEKHSLLCALLTFVPPQQPTCIPDSSYYFRKWTCTQWTIYILILCWRVEAKANWWILVFLPDHWKQQRNENLWNRGR